MAEDINITEGTGRRPLLEKIEEIKERHLGQASKTRNRSPVNDVEIMYKKQALAKALQSMDQVRRENMQDYRNMKERQQAAFQAMVQTQARQKGQAPQGQGQAGASQQQAQGGGLLGEQGGGQQAPAPRRAPGNSNIMFDSQN